MPMTDFAKGIERRGTDGVKWNLYGQDVLPMWVADSDFPCPDPVLEVLARRTAHGAYGYGFMDSMLDEAARHWMASRFGWETREPCSVYAPGLCAAISLTIAAFSQPGDGVVTFTPSYPPLLRLPASNGRTSLPSPLRATADGYEINFEDLQAKLALPRTSLLLLCNPHNPTGKVFTRNELLRIGALCRQHQVLIFSDEIHCDYIHRGKHLTLPALSDDLAQQCLVGINPSKTFNIAGLHTATVLSANGKLLGRFRSAVENASLHSNILGAHAFHAAYMRCADYADAVCRYTGDNLRFAADYVARNITRLKTRMPDSTYLLWMDCRDLGMGDEELKRFFLTKAKVALGWGLDFGPEGSGFVRLNAACPRNQVEEALNRIAEAVNAL